MLEPTITKSDKPIENLRKVREDALNNLATVVEFIWGSRCTRYEAGCVCCLAWSIFDQIENITDSSLLDYSEHTHDKSE